MKFSFAYLVTGVVVLGAVGETGIALAQQEPDFLTPSGHFTVERPADLDADEALDIYKRLLDDMVAIYALAGDPAAPAYRNWRRFNTKPYRSATHGDRFVNNYANGIGRDYGLFEDAGTMPVGTVLAKDAFAVTEQGEVYVGPLFLMEKMPAGFHPGSRDWRYSMIMPDGSVFGVTNGDKSEAVEFCITCHVAAGDEVDHLFFVPEEFRVRSEQ